MRQRSMLVSIIFNVVIAHSHLMKCSVCKYKIMMTKDFKDLKHYNRFYRLIHIMPLKTSDN